MKLGVVFSPSVRRSFDLARKEFALLRSGGVQPVAHTKSVIAEGQGFGQGLQYGSSALGLRALRMPSFR